MADCTGRARGADINARSFLTALSRSLSGCSCPSATTTVNPPRLLVDKRRPAQVLFLAAVKTTIRLRLDCNSIALQPFDNLRNNRRYMGCCNAAYKRIKNASVTAASGLRHLK